MPGTRLRTSDSACLRAGGPPRQATPYLLSSGDPGWRSYRYRYKRHTTALTVYRATKDLLRLVQRILGHFKVSTTAIHADVLDDDVAAAQDAAWPGC